MSAEEERDEDAAEQPRDERAVPELESPDDAGDDTDLLPLWPGPVALKGFGGNHQPGQPACGDDYERIVEVLE